MYHKNGDNSFFQNSHFQNETKAKKLFIVFGFLTIFLALLLVKAAIDVPVPIPEEISHGSVILATDDLLQASVDGTDLNFSTSDSNVINATISSTLFNGLPISLTSVTTNLTRLSNPKFKYGYSLAVTVITPGLLTVVQSINSTDNLSLTINNVSADNITTTGFSSDTIASDYQDVLANWNVLFSQDTDTSITVTMTRQIGTGLLTLNIDPTVIRTTGTGVTREGSFQRKVWIVNGTIYAFIMDATKGNYTSSWNGTTWNPPVTIDSASTGNIAEGGQDVDFNGTTFLYINRRNTGACSGENIRYYSGIPVNATASITWSAVSESPLRTFSTDGSIATLVANPVIGGNSSIFVTAAARTDGGSSCSPRMPTLSTMSGENFWNGVQVSLNASMSGADYSASVVRLNQTLWAPKFVLLVYPISSDNNGVANSTVPLQASECSGTGCTFRENTTVLYGNWNASYKPMVMNVSNVTEGIIPYVNGSKPLEIWTARRNFNNESTWSLNKVTGECVDLTASPQTGMFHPINTTFSYNNNTGTIYLFCANGTGIWQMNSTNFGSTWTTFNQIFVTTNATSIATSSFNYTNGTHAIFPLTWFKGNNWTYDSYAEKILLPLFNPNPVQSGITSANGTEIKSIATGNTAIFYSNWTNGTLLFNWTFSFNQSGSFVNDSTVSFWNTTNGTTEVNSTAVSRLFGLVQNIGMEDNITLNLTNRPIVNSSILNNPNMTTSAGNGTYSGGNGGWSNATSNLVGGGITATAFWGKDTGTNNLWLTATSSCSSSCNTKGISIIWNQSFYVNSSMVNPSVVMLEWNTTVITANGAARPGILEVWLMQPGGNYNLLNTTKCIPTVNIDPSTCSSTGAVEGLGIITQHTSLGLNVRNFTQVGTYNLTFNSTCKFVAAVTGTCLNVDYDDIQLTFYNSTAATNITVKANLTDIPIAQIQQQQVNLSSTENITNGNIYLEFYNFTSGAFVTSKQGGIFSTTKSIKSLGITGVNFSDIINSTGHSILRVIANNTGPAFEVDMDSINETLYPSWKWANRSYTTVSGDASKTLSGLFTATNSNGTYNQTPLLNLTVFSGVATLSQAINQTFSLKNSSPLAFIYYRLNSARITLTNLVSRFLSALSTNIQRITFVFQQNLGRFVSSLQQITFTNTVSRLLANARTNIQQITFTNMVSRLLSESRINMQQITLVNTVSRLFSASKTITQQITFTNTITRIFTFLRSSILQFTLNNIVQTAKAFGRLIIQKLSVINMITQYLNLIRTSTQQITFTNTITRVITFFRSSILKFTLANVVQSAKAFVKSVTQKLSITTDTFQSLMFGRTNVQQIKLTNVITIFNNIFRSNILHITFANFTQSGKLFLKSVSQLISLKTLISQVTASGRINIQKITFTNVISESFSFLRNISQQITFTNIIAIFSSLLKNVLALISLTNSVTSVKAIISPSNCITGNFIISAQFCGISSINGTNITSIPYGSTAIYFANWSSSVGLMNSTFSFNQTGTFVNDTFVWFNTTTKGAINARIAQGTVVGGTTLQNTTTYDQQYWNISDAPISDTNIPILTPTTSTTCINGVCTLTMFSGDMNYLNGSSYVPINTTILSDNSNGFNYSMTTAPYIARFKNDSDLSKAARFVKDTYAFDFDIATSQAQWFNSNNGAIGGNSLNPLHSTAIARSNSITYPNAWSGVNLTYTLNNVQMKESLAINSIPTNVSFANFFRYKINVFYNNSLQVCLDGTCHLHPTSLNVNTTNRVDFKDSNNVTEFFLPAPSVTDNLGNTSSATYFFNLNNGVDLWYIGIPADFIKNSSTVFPIYLDPTINLNESNKGNLGDAYVQWANGNNNTNFGTDSRIESAGAALNDIRSYILWNMSVVPANATITNANMSLYLVSNGFGASRDLTVFNTSLYNLTGAGPWVEGNADDNGAAGNCTGIGCNLDHNITWNNQPWCKTNNCPTPEGDVAQSNATILYPGRGLYYWNVTDAAISTFANTSFQNMSLMLRFADELSGAGTMLFASKENTTVSGRPQLIITYVLPIIPINYVSFNFTNSTTILQNQTATLNLTAYFVSNTSSVNYTYSIFNTSSKYWEEKQYGNISNTENGSPIYISINPFNYLNGSSFYFGNLSFNSTSPFQIGVDYIEFDAFPSWNWTNRSYTPVSSDVGKTLTGYFSAINNNSAYNQTNQLNLTIIPITTSNTFILQIVFKNIVSEIQVLFRTFPQNILFTNIVSELSSFFRQNILQIIFTNIITNLKSFTISISQNITLINIASGFSTGFHFVITTLQLFFTNAIRTIFFCQFGVTCPTPPPSIITPTTSTGILICSRGQDGTSYICTGTALSKNYYCLPKLPNEQFLPNTKLMLCINLPS